MAAMGSLSRAGRWSRSVFIAASHTTNQSWREAIQPGARARREGEGEVEVARRASAQAKLEEALVATAARHPGSMTLSLQNPL